MCTKLSGQQESGEVKTMAAGQVKLRDSRETPFYWIQHVLVDVFQPVIGPLGVTVYNALARQVQRNEQVIDVSLRELGASASVSKDTASRMLLKMRVLGMVGVRDGRYNRTEVELYDLDEVSGLPRRPSKQDMKDCIDALTKKLAAAEHAQKHAPPKKSRQELALEDPGLFDSLEEQMKDFAATEQAAPETPKEPEEVSLPETSCLKTGGVLSQKEGSLSQNSTPYLMLKEEKEEEKKHPPNPPVGRTLETVASVIAGLQRLKPRIGDVSDLREPVTALMRAAGFDVEPDFRIPDRGDGRAGTLDLFCTRLLFGVEPEYVAIECDATVARQKSIDKLRRLSNCYRVIVLRTAGEFTSTPRYTGIQSVIPLGWPGNGVETVAARGKAQQQARAAVGSADVGFEVTAHASSSAQVREGVRAALEAVREEMVEHSKAGTEPVFQEALREWDDNFKGVEYDSHEAGEGASQWLLIKLLSPQPGATLLGLKMFGHRLERHLRARLGCRVALQVVGEEVSAL